MMVAEEDALKASCRSCVLDVLIHERAHDRVWFMLAKIFADCATAATHVSVMVL